MRLVGLLFILCSLTLSCSDDEGDVSGNFTYTVSGAASTIVTGTETNSGISNNELFIRLTAGTDELIIRIIGDEAKTGSYIVNPILVNGQNQPIEDGDAFADLNLGSVFNGNQRDFSTNAANGGLVTITNVADNLLTGTFNMSLQELLGGGVDQPKINIVGEFTAIR